MGMGKAKGTSIITLQRMEGMMNVNEWILRRDGEDGEEGKEVSQVWIQEPSVRPSALSIPIRIRLGSAALDPFPIRSV